MMTADEIALLMFFALVGIHLVKRRKYLKLESVVILEFWKGGMNWLDKIVHNRRSLLKKVETVSLVTGIALSIVGIGFIGYSFIKMKQTMAVVLPSVGGVKYPGPVVSVPFWYWLIAIFIIAFPHETAHALFAKTEGVRIRKYGILYLLLLPLGAFVEPDEKRLKRLNWKKQAKIFSAGSFVNLLTGILFFLLLIASVYSFKNLFYQVGIGFKTIPGTPAYQAKLSGTIIKIDDHRIKNIYDLISFMNSTKPGENITIYTTKGVYNIKLAEKNGRAFIGISKIHEVYGLKITGKLIPDWIVRVFLYWTQLLWWVFVLSVGIAVANMLPAKPLDGGLTLEAFLKERIGKERGEKVSNVVSAIVWILLIIALFSSKITKFI